MRTKSLDLHPEKLPGKGPEAALRAARAFLDQALSAGVRELRLITGIGIHGDGTPRLRSRIEQDVLPAYFRHIRATAYEQGGAVIVLHLEPPPAKPNLRELRHRRHEEERGRSAANEGRLEIAWERLEAAEAALEERDLRKARLKLNQVAREFAWEALGKDPDAHALDAFLRASTARLKALDA